MTASSAPDANPVVPGRGCDGCTLCCKLLGIAELDKPANAVPELVELFKKNPKLREA